MGKYVRPVCEYVYDPIIGDPENEISPGVSFDNLSGSWVWHLCSASKATSL
jgi:rubredoxin